jgi:RND superfamily putative drug exporter
MFARWGGVVTRHPWVTIVVVAVLSLAGGVYGAGVFGSLSQGGYEDPGSEAVRASELAEAAGAISGDIVVIVTAPPGRDVGAPEVAAAAEDLLGDLPADSVASVISYWQTGDASLRSADGRRALGLITLAGEDAAANYDLFLELEPELTSDAVDVELAGPIPLEAAVTEQTQDDLILAEAVSLPVVLVLLVFIFGSVAAAMMPVMVGALAVAGSLGVLHLIATAATVSEFAVNVASLLGLGMAIDYGLFIVSRFREELAGGAATRDAVRTTLATAGRTVAFSATLLIIALATLTLFPQQFLTSIAYGGVAAVALAAALSLTVLPAVLGLLGHRIDKGSVRRRNRTEPSRFWPWLANGVMRHPLLVAVPILAGLAVLISPFLDAAFGPPDERILPADAPARIAVETVEAEFPELSGNEIQVVVDAALSPADGEAFAREIANIDGVTAVAPASPPGSPATILDVRYEGDVHGEQAQQAVESIRALDAPAEALVGGLTALNIDSLDAIGEQLPAMIAILVGATLVLMFLAFGSVVLPLKAILMSAVSLTATFGALTWLFVDGHGAGLLDITPQPMEVGIVVLMAALVFGLSTDYEVFLLSRIVEAHDHGATTEEAVRTGMTRSGRVITAAALLLITVTGAFSLSQIQMMRFVGVGMIIALVLDATVIRMLLVPALLKLLGPANWWLPGPLRRFQRRFAIRD